MRRAKIWLVQQSVWDLPMESLPLASGYMKAAAEADERIRRDCEIAIHNFGGGDSARSMASQLFGNELPDVLAFSVLGWNFRTFCILAETYRQLKPDGWVVFGGNHVTHQAERVLRVAPWVDVVVNGEGEHTFRELVAAILGAESRHELDAICGISFQRPDGEVVTTPARPRIMDLDEIPSPFLSGAVEMTDEKGEFRYDVALMETNRGCPYTCAFCYWGGAIGQKVRCFSSERLAAELDLFGFHQVESVVLCDANFGMMREDVVFLENLIATRGKHGFPRNLETCWAKNKSKTFFSIVRRMREAGLRSSFTAALQTLDGRALESMQRQNMKLNEWEDLVDWLGTEGLECYAELIWGVPGETRESFLEGYDRLARKVSRVAVYPLLLMPNTHYSEAREDFGLVTVRSDHDDFEYLLCHDTLSAAENREMHRFLFWARTIAEYMILRHVWMPLERLAGLSQSDLLFSLDHWIDDQSDAVAERLRGYRDTMVRECDASLISEGLHFIYEDPRIDDLLRRWWAEAICPRVPAHLSRFTRDLLDYDLMTRPIVEPIRPMASGSPELPVVEVAGEQYYVRREVSLDYDFPALLEAVRHGETSLPEPRTWVCDYYFKRGFETYIDNHEWVPYFVGKTREELTPAEFAPQALEEPAPLDRVTA